MAEVGKNKRTHSELSSLSENDTSLNTTPTKNPKKKANTKKQENMNENAMNDIRKELKQINEKLANVMTKNDESLKTLIKENIKQMQEELLSSVNKKIEILESKLFDKEQETDSLKKVNNSLKDDLSKLREENETQKIQNSKLKSEVRYSEQKTDEILNNAEQYSRLNNIRVTGIPEQKFPKIIVKNLKQQEKMKPKSGTSENQDNAIETADNTESDASKVSPETYAKIAKTGESEYQQDEIPENAEQTTQIFIKKMNDCITGLNLKPEDIDISHRIGKKGNKPRPIIVKFLSRLVKDKIMRNRALLPKTIGIMDDLTAQNYRVFQSVKYKKPHKVKAAWIRNGKIFFKDRDDYVHTVHYKNFEYWTSAPWPEHHMDQTHHKYR